MALGADVIQGGVQALDQTKLLSVWRSGPSFTVSVCERNLVEERFTIERLLEAVSLFDSREKRSATGFHGSRQMPCSARSESDKGRSGRIAG